MGGDLVYRYIPGTGVETLLLLHGTGGDENDLLEIGHAVMPGANLLSPRGPVLENGMPRFFRRFAEGVFDVEDIKKRAAELAGFIRDRAAEHGFDAARVMALGYSNGANIAAAMLLTGDFAFTRAVLLRPMVPLEPEAVPNLAGAEVLLAAGAHDPIATPAQVSRLGAVLRSAGAKVRLNTEPTGHQLSQRDIDVAAGWLGRG